MRLKTGHYGTQSHLVVPNVHLLLPKTMETVFEGAFPFDQPLIFEIPHCDRSHYIFSEQVDATSLFRIWICICGHYAKAYSQSQCTAVLMSLFSVLCVVSSACESAENAGRRLAVKLAAHPFSPRTALQSRDCHRVRVRRGCTAIFPPSALFPGISRRCTWRSVASTQAQRRYRASSLP